MSGRSRATGGVSEAASRKPGRGRDSREDNRSSRKAKAAAVLEVQLAHARWRHLGWTIGAVALGIMLLWKLGTVGQWLGVALCGFSLWTGRNFTLTLLRPAGRIQVGLDTLALPRGVCQGPAAELPVAKLKHAFMLRRNLPWMTTPPLLVVETDDKVYLYPRDWFSSDNDQRRVMLALNERLGRLGA